MSLLTILFRYSLEGYKGETISNNEKIDFFDIILDYLLIILYLCVNKT